jgi:regulator of replication initiation timing
MENKSLKVLFAYSEPLPEMEDEYDGVDELIDDAEMRSTLIDLITSIGSEEFEHIYNLFINEIRNFDISYQIALCNEIMKKIEEIYNFEFLGKITLHTQSDCEDIYKFLNFLEFDNIDFFVDLLYGIVEDLRNEPIRIIIENNWLMIESRILKENLSQLVMLFLRTNNKDELIDFFVSKITKNKAIITMKLFERRIENGESNN